jgi:biotin-dependent carboxylase-like uncharacterized protein
VIEVLRPGPLTTVQDLGRAGLAHLGVGRSGAADRPSLRLANRLVGNPEGEAGLETTLGGLAVRFESASLVALTGAPCPVRVGGRSRDMFAPVPVAAGEVLELGMPHAGVRTYLAVRGGLAVPAVLGARATDMLAQLGPAPLHAGDRLPLGSADGSHPGVDVAPVRALASEPVLRAVPGPRADWFTSRARVLLGTEPFEVSPASDRVGVRLTGPVLERARSGELPSEGVVEGAVQVPPDGHPVVFLADHPVTGGYPVIAVVHPDDIAVVAQVRPGQHLRFVLQPGLG